MPPIERPVQRGTPGARERWFRDTRLSCCVLQGKSCRTRFAPQGRSGFLLSNVCFRPIADISIEQMLMINAAFHASAGGAREELVVGDVAAGGLLDSPARNKPK